MLDKYDAKSFSNKLFPLSSFREQLAPTLSPHLKSSPLPHNRICQALTLLFMICYRSHIFPPHVPPPNTTQIRPHTSHHPNLRMLSPCHHLDLRTPLSFAHVATRESLQVKCATHECKERQ